MTPAKGTKIGYTRKLNNVDNVLDKGLPIFLNSATCSLQKQKKLLLSRKTREGKKGVFFLLTERSREERKERERENGKRNITT